MAKEKKPSIYSDRGTIGSSDELDEYGVCVKSEPQDLSEFPSDFSSGSPMDAPAEIPPDEPDLEIPDSEDLPDFENQGNYEDFNDFDISEAEADAEAEMEMQNLSSDVNDTAVSDNLGDFQDLTDSGGLTDFQDLTDAESIESKIPELVDFEPLTLDEPASVMEAPEEKAEDLGFTEIAIDDLTNSTSLEEPVEIAESEDFSSPAGE